MVMRNFFRRSSPVADHSGPRQVLVASEGRRISEDVIQLAARIARGHDGRVRVLSVARLWGTSFGLPNPGLKPSRREMAEQEDNVAQAIERLEALDVIADGHIVVTRHPAKSILREAGRLNCPAIVMGADPRRNPVVGSMMWSQEPHRVRRSAPIPVHLVGASPSPQKAGSYAEFKVASPAQSRLLSREKKIHSS
jgi:nucleotide-binding universal stress UspA family protein